MARPPARGPIRQHNIPIVEPSATSAFVAPISARSAPQVARSVSKIGTLSARRHDAERARPKTRYQKSASETEARDGDNEAQSETRRPGGIQRMPAFRADFREPPADNGADRTGWLTTPVLIGPVSHLKFPANREINREFRGFGPNSVILPSTQPATSMA